MIAYRLLKSANLSEHHQQLIRAAISDLTYESMKTQLLNFFSDGSKIGDSLSCDVKEKSVNEVSLCDQQEYYGSNHSMSHSNKSWKNNYGNRRGDYTSWSGFQHENRFGYVGLSRG